MSINRIFFILVLSILMVIGHSCDRSDDYSQILMEAEQLLQENPQEGYKNIQHIKSFFKNAPERDRQFLTLLEIKATDKSFVPHRSDSLSIANLIEYFRKEGPRERLAEVYYYAGRILEDNRDFTEALKFYQKAEQTILPVMGIAKSKTQLYTLILGHVGEMYRQGGLWDEAAQQFLKAVKIDEQNNDTIGLIQDCMPLVQILAYLGKVDSAKVMLNYADNLAKECSDKSIQSKVYMTMGYIYSNIAATRDYKKSIEALKKSLDNVAYYDSAHAIATLGSTYYRMHEYDSAAMYLKRILNTEDFSIRRIAYYCMTGIDIIRKDPASALWNLDKYISLEDSIKNSTYTSEMATLKAKYDYSLKELENLNLRASNVTQRLYLIICLSIICLLTAIILIIVLSRRKRKLQVRQIKVNHLRLEEDSTKANNEKLQLNRKRLEEVNRKLEDYPTDSHLLSLKDELAVEVKNIEIALALNQLRKQQASEKFKLTEGYKVMRQCVAERRIANTDIWEIWNRDFSENYAWFRQRLEQYLEPTEFQWRMCMLIRADFKPSEISLLLSTSAGNISTSRLRMYKKVFDEKGDSAKWDEFIMGL